MPRYVAFLRGVGPVNAKMPALQACFESAGFSNVRTLRTSGNVVFDARSSPMAALERRAEKAMQAGLGHSFDTYVRPATYLQQLIAADPFAEFSIAPQEKRVLIFLRRPVESAAELPIEREFGRILKLSGTEAFSAYVPGPKGSAFMALIERTFGADITTRTIDTVSKCAWA